MKKEINYTSYVILHDDIEKELVKEVGLHTAMVYLIIKSHKKIDNNMHCCYPSIDELSSECNIEKRMLHKHINKLVDSGWLKIKSGGTKVKRNSNYYFPKEKYMYTDVELNYISKIERRSTKQVEEIPAQDNNIPSLSGDFTPKGKYVDDDLFDEETEENEVVNIDNSSAGSDIIDIFYSNVNNYFGVSDTAIKTNKTIKQKLDVLAGFVEDDNVEKVITDIMKKNQKSFTNGLKKANVPNDFKKCTYIISCVQNKIKDKKTKTEKKDDKITAIDDVDLVDYMNDNFIGLSKGEICKEDAIKRIELKVNSSEKTAKEVAMKIIFDVLKDYKKQKLKELHISGLRKVVKQLNEFYGYEILLDNHIDIAI